MDELQVSPPVPPPPVIPGDVVLTDEQKLAIDFIMAWVKDPMGPQEYKLGGFAGTGKTTIIKVIVKLMYEAHITNSVHAFTGKACHVLRRKGVHSTTLHALLYYCEVVNGEYIWTKRTPYEIKSQVLIVDEASMVSNELYTDLRDSGKRLLFVGDPGQLEPVGDNPDLMAQPNLVLEKIHRQAEKSPIISLANSVRKGGQIVRCEGPELVVRDKNITKEILADVDQFICARNLTRMNMNIAIRKIMNLTPGELCPPHEKIIVLQNNRAFDVFNGLIMYVTKIHDLVNDQYWLIDTIDDAEVVRTKLPVWKGPFRKKMDTKEALRELPFYETGMLGFKSRYQRKQKLIYADFGYAITCHKSQGSEWDHVLVLDEWMPPQVWDMKRWRYTAITRAAKKLTYCI